MKEASSSMGMNDGALRSLNHSARPAPGAERRERADRRRRPWWSVVYGSFNPRRRRPARRLDDSRFHPVDWYSAHLLAVSIGILLLSATDAFLTSYLLLHGADEVNPVMAVLVYRSIAMFAGQNVHHRRQHHNHGVSVALPLHASGPRGTCAVRRVGGLHLAHRLRALDAEGLERYAALVISGRAVTFHIAPPSAKLRRPREFISFLIPLMYLRFVTARFLS